MLHLVLERPGGGKEETGRTSRSELQEGLGQERELVSKVCSDFIAWGTKPTRNLCGVCVNIYYSLHSSPRLPAHIRQ